MMPHMTTSPKMHKKPSYTTSTMSSFDRPLREDRNRSRRENAYRDASHCKDHLDKSRGGRGRSRSRAATTMNAVVRRLDTIALETSIVPSIPTTKLSRHQLIQSWVTFTTIQEEKIQPNASPKRHRLAEQGTCCTSICLR